MSKAMQQGTLNAEPEVELDLRRQRQKERHGGSDSEDEDSENGESDANEDDDEGGASAQVPQWGTKWKAWKDPANQPDGPGFVAKEGAPEEEDDFFE